LKRKLLILFFLVFWLLPFAQDENPDSLQQILLVSTGNKKVDILNRIAVSYSSTSPEKAIEYSNLALKEATENEYKKGIVDAFNNIGMAYTTLSQYETALNFHQKAAVVAFEINDKSCIASAYSNIGRVYWRLQIMEKAMEYYFKSLKIQYELKDDNAIAKTLNNIGLVYFEDGNLESAKEYFLESLAKNTKLKNDNLIAATLSNLGMVYTSEKKYNQALEYYNEAMEIMEKNGSLNGLSTTANNIGETYYKKGDFTKAIEYTNKGLEYGKKIGIKRLIMQSYLVLSEIYDTLGDYKSAHNYFTLFVKYEDSLDFDENTTLLKQLENFNKELEINSIQRDQKQMQEINEAQTRSRETIAILLGVLLLYVIVHLIFLIRSNKRKNDLNNILAERNIQLEELNHKLLKSEKELLDSSNTKDRLFSIIGHDLRSPYNILLGYSELLYEEYDELDDETKKKYIAELNKSANISFQLLENLLHWSRLQTGKPSLKPELINITEILDNALALVSLNAQGKNIRVTNLVDFNYQIVADKNMVATIFRNLVSNAVKFTGKGGYVYISAISHPKHDEFSIKDTGIGMTESDIEKILMETPVINFGTAGEKGLGLGLEITRQFIKMHHGELLIESVPGQGSLFKFTIPKTEGK